nr:zinc finger, CCHC-type [Tanacetum cinerariifolium]
ETAFAFPAVDKIYAHESLTFNNTVACEVISKWKVRLKDGMDARSDVYVLSNGCRKCSDDSGVYYWEYTPGLLVKAKRNILGLEIIRDQSAKSHEYQMVCMRLDIASEDVGMLNKFDRGLQKDVQTAGTGTFTSIFKYPALKQLAIKQGDEYGFVIRPCLVGVTCKSEKINM